MTTIDTPPVPPGVRVRHGRDGRPVLLATGAGAPRLCEVLLSHPEVSDAVAVRQDGRVTAVVVPRHPTNRVEHVVARVDRLGPRRILQLGLGDPGLPVALAALCPEYRLIDVPDSGVTEPADLVLLDLSAPSMSTVDVVGSAAGALGEAGRGSAVLVANLRDPRLQWLSRDGTAQSTPDSAGWSPPAVLRALAALPGVTGYAFPPLDLTGEFDLLLRHAVPEQPRPMILRWNRDVLSLSQLDSVLELSQVDLLRLVGIPVAGLVDAVAAWRTDGGEGADRVRYRLGNGVAWADLAACCAARGYSAVPAAASTGAEYHCDALVAGPSASAPWPEAVGPLAERLRRRVAIHGVLPDGPLDVVVLPAHELAKWRST